MIRAASALLGPLLLVAAAAPPALAGDRQFDAIVKRFEAHYGRRKTHIPLMGMVTFFSNVTRPAGASGLRLAVFEDVRYESRPEGEQLERLIGGPHSSWLPFVRSHSRRDSETACIYVSPAGGRWRMLILTFENDETTLVEVSLSQQAIREWIDEPQHQERGRHARNGD